MSGKPISLYDAAIDLAQALLKPRPLSSGPSDGGLAIVRASREVMASLALHDSDVLPLEPGDVAAFLRTLATVVDTCQVPIRAGLVTAVSRLTTAITDALEGGAA